MEDLRTNKQVHWWSRTRRMGRIGRPFAGGPDYEERRRGGHLLVWRDIPYWMIVDDELGALMRSMDASRSLGEILDGLPPVQRKATLQVLRHLVAAGIVSDGPPAGPPKGREPGPGIANISINVTARCNLRCRFCYNQDPGHAPVGDELSAQEVTQFLDSIRPLLTGDCSLTLLGGEPLLVADKTLSLARYGRRHGLQTIVSTNGHAVTDDFADAARRCRLQVQVSLDGPTAQAHDAIRGPGSYDRALAAIRRLVDRRVFTIVSLVCHSGNVHLLEPFYSLAQSLGVNEARFIPLKRLGGACKAGLAPVDPKDLIVAASSMLRRHPEFRTLMGRDALSILAGTCGRALRQSSCGTGLRTFLLDAGGDLYPCLNTCVPRLRVGNIRDAGFDFAALWARSPVLTAVREATSVETPANKCYNCVVKYWCLGYCRGETLHATGSLAERAADCDRQRAAILEVFWMLGSEPDLAGKRPV